MKVPTDIPAYNILYHRKCWEALIAQVTQILINRLGIYEGNNLVGLIGDGSEKTNFHAIQNWVSNCIGYFEEKSALEIANELENELHLALIDILMTNH